MTHKAILKWLDEVDVKTDVVPYSDEAASTNNPS